MFYEIILTDTITDDSCCGTVFSRKSIIVSSKFGLMREFYYHNIYDRSDPTEGNFDHTFILKNP